MSETVLITGGAGFIGSHLADQLLWRGWQVRVLDSIDSQVHGTDTPTPSLNKDAELQVGDVRDSDALRRALVGVDAVVHLAARVGVGQSMYEMRSYTDVNASGTAALLEALMTHPVRGLVVASSMSIYGEGRYKTPEGRVVDSCERTLAQLQEDDWEPRDVDSQLLIPVPTPEDKPPVISSVYSLSKFYQERMCLMFGAAYQIPSVALRLFNVYGARQSLSNPYTGVLAIFASRLLNDRPPVLFEDGNQRRDFVHVSDVARAFVLALDNSERAAGLALNVGSGTSVSIRELAAKLASRLGKSIEPIITRDYRIGDIRHCFADVARAAEQIGYAPQVTLNAGLSDYVEWVAGQTTDDGVDKAAAELTSRGLTI